MPKTKKEKEEIAELEAEVKAANPTDGEVAEESSEARPKTVTAPDLPKIQERVDFPASVHGTGRFQVVHLHGVARVYGKKGEPVSGPTTMNHATWLANRFNRLDPEQRGRKVLLPGGGNIDPNV